MKSILLKFLNSPFHGKRQIFTVWCLLSYLLVATNSGWGFLGVVLAPDFLPALTFTIFIAAILTIYIHELSFILEDRYPLKYARKKRLITQGILGVLVPILFELATVSLYFLAKNENVFSNSFFDIDFILVVVFLLSLNSFYIHAYAVYKYKIKVETTFSERIKPAFRELTQLRKIHRLKIISSAPVFIADFNLAEVGIMSDQIACAYKIDEQITIHYFNESQETTKKPISRLFAGLPEQDYVQINPYCFYHRLVIFNWHEVGKSRRLYLVLRHPFTNLNHDYQRYVSQGSSKAFKVWIEPRNTT